MNNKWTSENIPNLEGKTIIVTGSSSGIGFETAKALAAKGAHVVMAVRNKQKGNNAIDKIKKEFPDAKLHMLTLDLADLDSVRQFAREFNSNFEQLDILINNAGVMIPPYSKTKDGFELQMGTNHMGHFALTGLLLHKIVSTPNSCIVVVASQAHRYGNINFDDLNWEKRKYKDWNAYGDSKLANLYFAYGLSRRLKEHGYKTVVTAAHPGWTATELQRHSKLFELLNGIFAMPAWQGALPTLRAACDVSLNTGDYLGPHGLGEWRGYPVIVKSNKLSYRTDIGDRLWDVSEVLTKVQFEF